MAVKIKVGEHKGEIGMVQGTRGHGEYEVLTLAGHTHLYQAHELEWPTAEVTCSR